MDQEGLKRRLSAEGFRDDAYDLVGEEWASETYVLRPEGDEWTVYYAERGLQSGKRLFSSEQEACEYFLELLRSDPSAKAR